ncbi:MAG TPA: hypothetical protein VEW03_09190, partial [Longimicrobiaceae bacterium]|nr:hypothetical protein [Longimicrobiaceae bacterium]
MNRSLLRAPLFPLVPQLLPGRDKPCPYDSTATADRDKLCPYNRKQQQRENAHYKLGTGHYGP